MKALKIIIVMIAISSSIVTHINAKTVTEGTLDLNEMAEKISGDLDNYRSRKEELIDRIKSEKGDINELNKSLSRIDNDKDRFTIHAKTLKKGARLLRDYEEVYSLNIETTESIVPKLRKMKEFAQKGALGKIHRQLQNPHFRTGMKKLYSNLSAMGLAMGDPQLKKELALLMGEYDRLHRGNSKGRSAYEKLSGKLDRMISYLNSVYAKSKLRLRIIEQKKLKHQLAIELMKQGLIVKSLHETMISIDPEGILEMPEPDYDEIIDPVISGDADNTFPDNPETDIVLKDYVDKGPEFLRGGIE